MRCGFSCRSTNGRGIALNEHEVEEQTWAVLRLERPDATNAAYGGELLVPCPVGIVVTPMLHHNHPGVADKGDLVRGQCRHGIAHGVASGEYVAVAHDLLGGRK